MPMMSRIAFAFLVAVAALAAAAAPAATTVEDGYEITRSQTVVPVPRGKLGRKTIDRETRTGNTQDTDGSSSNFTMTIGGFINKCPMPEGTAPVKFVLAGDFEFSLILDTVDTDVVPTERKHYAKRVNLRLKAVVNDDLSITEAEFNGDYTADIEGVRTGPVQIHRRFRIGEGGMPDMAALKDIAVTSDLAAAALAWNASQVVLLVRPELYKPNACAELQFDPPSESRTVAPGETVEIRVNYRTRDDQQPIPNGKWRAEAVQGGRVPGAVEQVRPDGGFIVKYTARSDSDPKEGDGMRAEAWSPAGLANEHWKIRVGGDYELHFESSIVSREPVQSVQSTARGSARLTASTKPWRRKPDGKMYRLYDGNGSLQFSSAPGPERKVCDPLISGSGTSQLQVLETWIQITPPSEQNGARVPGKADVQMTYWIPMGAGETETLQTNVNFRCVPGDVNPFPFWWTSYMSGREPDGNINFLTNWEYVGQDGVVARKVLTGTCGGMCNEERSVFTLRKVGSQ